MSENNYGALMMKSAVAAGDDINAIVQPGIYIIPPANSSSPDAAGGVLTVHSGSPIRRTFTSDSIITLTSTRNGNAWTAWKGPLSRTNPGADIKADGAAAIAEFLSNLGMPALLDARQPINDTLTAFARLDGQAGNAANNIPYFSGKNAVTATALTAFMRSMFGKADATEVLALLGVPALLDSRQPINDTLTAFARLDGQAGNAANNIPYFSGKNAVTATALTAFMRSMFGKADATEVLALLGTKTAALRDVGTGANQIPDMGSFTFSNATQGFKKDPTGAMEQWFSATIPIAPSATVNGTIDVLFPNPFPNKCYGVHVSYAGITATRDGTPFVSGMVVDKFACRLASTYLNSGLDVFVRAVGY